MLPSAGHSGQVTFRVDSAYYAAELLTALRKSGARFTVSLPRTPAMCKLVGQIADSAWADAIDLPGAQIAEVAYAPGGWRHEPLRLIVRRTLYSAAQISANPRARRRKTIHPDQLAMLLDGQTSSVYASSLILTDIHDRPAAAVEHFHRHRAQIEERPQRRKARPSTAAHALRRPARQPHLDDRLPARAEPHRHDLRPVPGRRRLGQGPRRRAAATRRQDAQIRRLLFNIPARIITSARQTILRLPAGHRHATTLAATYHAALSLPAP